MSLVCQVHALAEQDITKGLDLHESLLPNAFSHFSLYEEAHYAPDTPLVHVQGDAELCSVATAESVSHLTDEQQLQLRSLLDQYDDVFSADQAQVEGHTHEINITGNTPPSNVSSEEI